MADVFSIREAEAEDTPQILSVLRAALGESPLLRRTPELFAWKHLDNPFGRSIVLVATRGSQVVGVRALMRWELVLPRGMTIKCVRPVDTATHPDFSRKGIFRALTLEALDAARDSGVQLVFNTPNRMSAAGYFSMGWKEVGWMGAIVRPRLGKAISVKNGQSPSIAEAVPDAQPFRAADVADRAPLGLRTPRTPEYLSWRFSRHPTAQYGWLGDTSGCGLVVRASQRNGRVETVIADLLGGRQGRPAGGKAQGREKVASFHGGAPSRHGGKAESVRIIRESGSVLKPRAFSTEGHGQVNWQPREQAAWSS